ncbi:isovaleryl-CoA dehydrogenase [Arenimonas sp.]|uniref:isovaleryl-CoA dehydrogenase n=1 Tax=Arenimonas sp. TaxID=1872635 RepID=UPI0039E295F7
MGVGRGFETHEVGNQPPPLSPYDAYATDLPLREALRANGGAWAEDRVAKLGPLVGGEMMELGRLANENPPKLQTFDRYGHRIDQVEFHPAYHRLMQNAVAHGVVNFGWKHANTPGAHVARAALMYLHNQADQGTSCPLTMSYACIPSLQQAPTLASSWLPRVLSDAYDAAHAPAWEKTGNTIGMGMTEKQGGSDVRSNATRATALGDGLYELVGHKWFFSAPMCDAFLVLAQAEAGLSCFLLPRFAPDGTRNGIRLQRLKDKLGDRSNASSEVEFDHALAWRVGDEGRGIATILQMVALTRQDCLIGSASLMRQALVQALHHARHRLAFGRRLVEQPLMRNVLADLALESEAATALALRVARAIDAGPRDARAAAFARLATALGKYWVCKRAPGFVNEAQECLGGAGYVEESGLPRLYRQAPLNSIWEGSGNIQCLDVLRVLQREPECAREYFAELEAVRGADDRLDAEAIRLRACLQADPANAEAQARALTERLVLALQAATLWRHGEAHVAAAFCRARLARESGLAYGTLPVDSPIPILLERALQ